MWALLGLFLFFFCPSCQVRFPQKLLGMGHYLNLLSFQCWQPMRSKADKFSIISFIFLLVRLIISFCKRPSLFRVIGNSGKCERTTHPPPLHQLDLDIVILPLGLTLIAFGAGGGVCMCLPPLSLSTPFQLY